MIAALYVAPDGPYVGHAEIDAWTEERDARKYDGPWPVVAHPPCQRWGRLAKGSPLYQRFKVGDDGGCFAAALQAVQRFGGVIEHPQGSHAWRTFDLPIPEGRGWTVADRFGGRSCYIDQGAYGHTAKKPTWLYAILPAFPKLDWTRVWDRPYVMSGGYHSARERARAKKRVVAHHSNGVIAPEERYLTPAPFKAILLQLASSCQGWRPVERQKQARLEREVGEPR